MTTRLLKIPEVMAHLRVSRSTLHELMKRGELPVVRLGRCVRIPAEALDRLAERAVAA